MIDEYMFAAACRFWGYRPHELQKRPDKDWLVAQATMLQSAKNQGREIAADIAKKRG